jgi:hypothetical protein
MEGAVDFIKKQYPNIALFIGTVMLITNTTQMSTSAQTDKNINSYYTLNILSIIFLGVFILAHYSAEYMNSPPSLR